MSEYIAENIYEVKPGRRGVPTGSVPRTKTASRVVDPAQLDLIDVVNAAVRREAIEDKLAAQMLRFFSAILPPDQDGSRYLIVSPSKPTHKPIGSPRCCTSLRSLARETARCVLAGQSVWHCSARFSFDAMASSIATEKTTGRVEAAVDGVMTLHGDVDLADPTFDRAAAIASLNAYTDACGMPRAMVVASGSGGFHFYVLLDRVVSVADFKTMSHAMLATLKAYEPRLCTDTTKFTGANDLLRPHGSINRKPSNGPQGKSVRIIQNDGGRWDVDAALAWAGAQGVSPSVTHSAAYTTKERAYAYSSNVPQHLVQRAVKEREKVDAARANGEPYPWHSGMARQAYDDRHHKARNDWRIERELASPEWIEAAGADPDTSFTTRAGCRKFILRLVRELKVGMPETKARALYHQFAANDPGYGTGNRTAADNDALFDQVLAEQWDRLRCERIANLNNLFDQRASAGLSDDATLISNNTKPGSEHVS